MKKKSSPIRIFATAIFFGLALFLALFAHYLWNYDYKIQKPDKRTASHAVFIAAALTLKSPQPGIAEVAAEFTLTNQGSEKLSLLDTAALEPLYQIQLQQRAKKEDSWRPVPLAHGAGQALSIARGNIFDPARDSIVELLPSRSLSRTIVLSALFNMQNEGQYHLTAIYRPGALGAELEDYNVARQETGAILDFELPQK